MARDGTIVILGLDAEPGAQDARQALWTISDGAVTEIDPTGRSADGRSWEVTGLSVTDHGYVLTASRLRKDDSMVAGIWRSGDGLTWTKVDATDGYGTAIHGSNGMLLWFGVEVPANRRSARGWVATSEDGSSWQIGAFQDGTTVTDVVTVDERVLVTGEYDDQDQDTWAGLWAGTRMPASVGPGTTPTSIVQRPSTGCRPDA